MDTFEELVPRIADLKIKRELWNWSNIELDFVEDPLIGEVGGLR